MADDQTVKLSDLEKLEASFECRQKLPDGTWVGADAIRWNETICVRQYGVHGPFIPAYRVEE